MTDSQDPRPAGRTRGAPSRKPGDRIDALTPADDESGPLTRTGAELRAALAGRYEIEREIGRGGMATVYLAVDLRHERRVALKVVNPSLGAALSAKRFLREIRVTAGLTHPHILPLHDSGEADGLLYYVMPYVEGETLRERLTRGPMTSDAVLRLMREVASALSYAHRQGVVHRDIKP
jgi:serine/threonine-protein kinase